MRFLLRPGWLAFIALVVGFAVACYALLAPWQFGREKQREAQERAIATADATPPVPLVELVPPGVRGDPGARVAAGDGHGHLPGRGRGPGAPADAGQQGGGRGAHADAPRRRPGRRRGPRARDAHGRRRGAGLPRGARRHGHGDGAAARGPARPVGSTGRARCGGRHSSTPPTRPCSARRRGWTSLRGSSSSRRTSPVCSLRRRSGRRWRTPRPSRTSPTPCSGWTFGLIALVALGYFIRLEMLQRRGGGSRRTRRTEVRRALAGDDIGSDA